MSSIQSVSRSFILLTYILLHGQEDAHAKADPGEVVWVTNITRVTLDCSGEKGAQNMQFRWTFNDKTISTPSEKMTVLEDYSLVIRNVTKEDEGWYRCLNGNNTIKEHELKIPDPRSSIHFCERITAKRSMTINLPCYITGNVGNYQWTLNNFTLTIGEHFVRRMPVDKMCLTKNYTLQIRNVDTVDEGRYTCREKTKVIAEFLLNIKDSSPYLPFFETITVVESGSVYLPCFIAGNTGNYQWTFNNLTLAIGEHFVRRIPNGKINLFENYTLEVRNVNITDEGWYQCKEKTKVVAEFLLKVAIIPQMVILLNGKKSLPGHRFQKGETLRITCLAKNARPSVLLMWLVNNMTVPMSSYNVTIRPNKVVKGTFDSKTELFYTAIGGKESIQCLSNWYSPQQGVGVSIFGSMTTRKLNFDLKFDQIEIILPSIAVLVLFLLATLTIRVWRKKFRTAASNPSELSERKSSQSSKTSMNFHHNIENDLEASINENEEYYASIAVGFDYAQIVQKSDIIFLVTLKQGSQFDLDRWIGKINLSGTTHKSVVISTQTENECLEHELDWISHVKKIATLKGSMFIAGIEGICFDKEKIYVLHEYCYKGTLEKYLLLQSNQRETSLGIRREIVTDVISGIDFLHNNKLLHPGLSTRKILLADDGRCKLYDFCSEDNVSKKIFRLKSKQPGNLNNFSPEVITKNEYTNASDVWSLAVIMWILLVDANPPFPERISMESFEVPIKPEKTSPAM